MTKAKTETKSKIAMNDLPPIKPWCFRVALTTAKKRGARENWPRDMREARARTRKEKRNARGDHKEEELRLRAESKTGGIEAKIARMKLRALKQRKIICAEEKRRELVTRIVKFREARGLGSQDEALAQSQTQTIAKSKPSTSTQRSKLTG